MEIKPNGDMTEVMKEMGRNVKPSFTKSPNNPLSKGAYSGNSGRLVYRRDTSS